MARWRMAAHLLLIRRIGTFNSILSRANLHVLQTNVRLQMYSTVRGAHDPNHVLVLDTNSQRLMTIPDRNTAYWDVSIGNGRSNFRTFRSSRYIVCKERKYADKAGRSFELASVYPWRREPLNLSATTLPHQGLGATPEVMLRIKYVKWKAQELAAQVLREDDAVGWRIKIGLKQRDRTETVRGRCDAQGTVEGGTTPATPLRSGSATDEARVVESSGIHDRQNMRRSEVVDTKRWNETG
ncbi:hypothetical protein B0H13DRAFT_1936381 [Mycena leptocephala]|nr:hypothetical protein B0H13DRAFT_1936381 [Mycena leptocephala]